MTGGAYCSVRPRNASLRHVIRDYETAGLAHQQLEASLLEVVIGA